MVCNGIVGADENPILILTHGDKLSMEDRIDSRLKICEHLGISETAGVYDIVCLTEYGFLADEIDPVTAYALTEAVIGHCSSQTGATFQRKTSAIGQCFLCHCSCASLLLSLLSLLIFSPNLGRGAN